MMEIIERVERGTAVVEIHGKLIGGPENTDAFHNVFKSLLKQGRDKIVVNLGLTPWANSQGIGMLIGAYTSVRNAGGELVISDATERIMDILFVTKLGLIFKTFETEERAVNYLTEKYSTRPADRSGQQPTIGT
jgi:anti-sigma B factor antagonist